MSETQATTSMQAETPEPVLPMSDIQGIAVPGFLKPHQTLVGVSTPNDPGAVVAFKEFLRGLAGEISTAAETLADRRRFRVAKAAAGPKPPAAKALLGIGFTFQGLQKLTPGAVSLPSEAFRQGLAARSAFLGDPADPADEGNPKNWKVGAPGRDIDVLFIVAGDTRAAVDERAAALAGRIEKAGLQVVYNENGDVREDLPGHEQFGFDDGVSQPGIRGRASDDPNDFVTTRHIAVSAQPERSLFGYPGQDLVWPGVLVLGHPATSPDPLIPGLPSPAVPEWSRNGSYLVFRRLRQDVGLFWRTMRQEAARLAALPGFEDITDVVLASRIVGRWPSGAPVNRVPLADDPDLGAQPLANNHFRFDSDASAIPLQSGYVDKFPQSKADPAGVTCPWAAHIRKVNTRDSGSDTGGRDSSYARRLMRVGVAFGKPLADRYAEPEDDPGHGERGLLFLGIQASIDDQFEFLTARWMGDPSRPKMPGGHDLLVGQNDAPGESRQRRCVIFGSGLQQASVATDAPWIIPTGGGYFFVPSIAALRDVLGR
ncbi:MAG: Dyp-type peroxidase [Bryobacteraceae bacterium]|jgi:Dyp-type peroxidase family